MRRNAQSELNNLGWNVDEFSEKVDKENNNMWSGAMLNMFVFQNWPTQSCNVGL